MAPCWCDCILMHKVSCLKVWCLQFPTGNCEVLFCSVMNQINVIKQVKYYVVFLICKLINAANDVYIYITNQHQFICNYFTHKQLSNNLFALKR